MPKSFTIVSHHRNGLLALAHATRLGREFSATVRTQRLNESGKFSSRGKVFRFTVTPHQKKMYRIIVGYPYLQNKKKQKSPDARTMKAIYYAKTKQKVLAEKSRLRRAAQHEIKKLDRPEGKAWIQDRKKHPLYRRVNVQVSQVEYDDRFIGITEYLDD